jgi:carboxypeptidase Taq
MPTAMKTTQATHPKILELQTRLREINDIESAVALLDWDQATYMPTGGATARGRQLATLRQIAHQKFTDPTIAQLLEDLSSYADSLPDDDNDACLIRVAQRDYNRAVRVPAAFMAKLSTHQSATYEAWAKAREADDFTLVQPYLEMMVALSQELAGFFPGHDHIADPLIDRSDYGMTVAMLRPLFAQLREELVPLVETIASQPCANDAMLHQHFPGQQQLDFCRMVAERIGYDFYRGRQDTTLHPFTTKFSLGDVRITTRVYENDLTQALFSSIHEVGHALYEQGISPEFEATSLDGGVSSGIHESQSRLWENLVGRSRGFWEGFYPKLQGVFIRQLAGVSIDKFYRAINKVSRSLIRTDADEVTYNLHVMIRFDLELALLEQDLSVRDLPDAWRERYRSDLGIAPETDRDGVLQDVHWYSGLVGGMFQGYTLGNLLGTQFYETALSQNPEIPVDIERGNFHSLHQWLQENIYQYGRKYTPTELVKRVTGTSVSITPFIRYIRSKYGQLYHL